MKAYITPHTLANTVRMTRKRERPVLLAQRTEEARLLAAVAGIPDFRIIPTHTKENAFGALKILILGGWNGVVTLVPPEPESNPWVDRLGLPLSDEYDIEFVGEWEEVAAHAEEFSGKKVSIRVLPANGHDNGDKPKPNEALLRALANVEQIQKGMEPKEDKDTLRYLREARLGDMYGYSDSD